MTVVGCFEHILPKGWNETAIWQPHSPYLFEGGTGNCIT